MARSKKAVEEILEDEDFTSESAEPAPPPAAAATKRVKTRQVQEWIEDVPTTIDQPWNAGNIVDIEEPPAVAPEPVKPAKDEIGEYLDFIENDTGNQYAMTVYRLPNYEKDFNCSMRARKVVCGSVPFGLDYEDVIQQRWARKGKCNDYFVLIRKNGKIDRQLPVVQIEPIDEPPRPREIPEMHSQAAPGALATVDPLQQMRETMKFMAELQRTMMPLFQPPAAAQAVGEISTEAALLKLIEQSPEQIARVTEKFFPAAGNPSDGESWFSLIKEMLPALQPLIGAFIQKLTTPAAPPPAPTSANATVDALPLDPQAARAPSPAEEKYIYIINRMLQGIDNGLDAGFVGEEIDMVISQVPELAATISNLMSVPPAQVLKTLQGVFPGAQKICQEPTAEQWISDLQAYWTDTGSDEEGAHLEPIK